jgi:hypothetical protein
MLKSIKAGSQPSSQESAKQQKVLGELASKALAEPRNGAIKALPASWVLRFLLQSNAPDREQRKATALAILQALVGSNSFREFAAEAPAYDIAARMREDAGFPAEVIDHMLNTYRL